MFTAPTAGEYVFDTVDSDYDTALAAFSSCDPTSEIACNDDLAGQMSQIALDLDAGESVYIVIDGWDGATGDWVLNINAGIAACIEEDIGGSVGAAVASGSTVGEDWDIAQSCGEGGGPETMVGFTAPSTATYTFDTNGSGYDTVLSVSDSCDPEDEIVCDDDGGTGYQSSLSVALDAGETVVVAVSGYDGATGSWVLNITQS